ncbi:longitudinals lacking protein, isoforms F/I/K/T isoform X10 [Nasonia vitripennis]|uniref:Longitudinals lacking protein n=1 Tax=Nasonia vitripennis TaxID=7425 RepID=A0A7M7TAJ7_NASVI|nr:longitudinals lacking protein, isoforms F/I/K/T isoform X10 [Nasonia vitripennis]XP_032456423.1 longitudinals lacking protein, isoforms F/I/K/T isoform X10 [Nasonia vitripennis]
MEDDQQFCLRWNNHQSTIIQNFDTLLESGTLVDCTLAAEGKYLKAHKVVLSACSPYFEGLLSEHYDKHPVFILKDVKFKELKAMMDYMYRGEVNISQDQLTALLKAAESLQIKGLSDSRTDKGTGNTGNTTTGGSKDNTRPAKTASSTAAASASAAAVDIPHTSSGLTIEKNSKVPRQSIQQVSVSDQLENSASPQLRGHSSREGSQSPTRKRKRLRRRSLGNDDNSMENHEASNSSDVNMTAPALGVAPVAEEKSQADPADSIGRSALMQQLTKPADEMLQMPLEKPEPSEDMIQPKSEYQDDQESVEDLTNFDDDMNDLNEMEQDNSRAGPSHDPSQHAGMPSWHIAGDRSNASVVGAAAGPGAGDEVFLAAAEAAQAQRDSQGNRRETKRTLARNDSQKKSSHQPKASTEDEPVNVIPEVHYIKEEVVYESDDSNGFNKNPETLEIDVQNIQDKTLKNILMGQPSVLMEGEEVTEIEEVFVEEFEYRGPSSPSDEMLNVYCELCGRTSKKPLDYDADCELRCQDCENLLQFQCMKCNRLYRMHDSALSHVRYSCPSATTLYCSQCEFRTNRKRNLQIHIKNAHSDPSTENQHQCKQCQKKYKRRKHLQRHEKSCGKLPHIPCRFCSYKCKRNDHLLQHMQHRHPKRGVKPVSPMAYSCSKCDKKYKYQTSLRDHEPYCKGRVKQEPMDEPDKKKIKKKGR